jgi:hypothetical protein
MISWRGGLFYAGSAATATATAGVPGAGRTATSSIPQSFVISDVDIDGGGGGLFNVTLVSSHRKGRLVLGNVRPVVEGNDDITGGNGTIDRPIGIVQSSDGLKREIGRVRFARVEGMGECASVDVKKHIANGAVALSTTYLGDAACVLSFSGTLDDVNAALRRVTYIPNTDATGADTVVLSVNDTGHEGYSGVALVATAKLDVWIDAVNDPPTITAPHAVSVALDGGDDLDAFDGTQIFSIQVGDVDMNDATMVATLTLDLLPRDGASMTLASLVGLTFTRGGGVEHSALTVIGTLEHLNRALYGMTFLCGPTCRGNYSTDSPSSALTTVQLLIAIDDNGQSGEGGELRAARTVDIHIQRTR